MQAAASAPTEAGPDSVEDTQPPASPLSSGEDGTPQWEAVVQVLLILYFVNILCKCTPQIVERACWPGNGRDFKGCRLRCCDADVNSRVARC